MSSNKMSPEPFVSKTDYEFAHPEFTIEKYPITARFLTKDELPADLNDFGDYGGAFAGLQKLNDGKFADQIPNLHAFTLYLNQMYRMAREEGTAVCFTYNGEDHIDFPVENTANKVRLYASFIPHRQYTGKWFCVGIRPGSKIHDFADLKPIDSDYMYFRKHYKLAENGIKSKFALRERVEDSFVEAAIAGEVYQYSIEGRSFIEFPLLLEVNNGTQQYTMQLEIIRGRPKWKFISYYLRGTKYPLEIGIEKGVSHLWRQEYHSEALAAEEKKELVKLEEEYKRKEAEKQLIPFTPFFPRKIEASLEDKHSHYLKAFAYITRPPVLFLPSKGIDVRDPDVVLDAIEKAFSQCNPYLDIDYYQYPFGERAELRIRIPGYESTSLYASFERNKLSGYQPWHLRETLAYQDIYDRVLFVPNYEKTLDNLRKICPSCEIDSAAELEQFMHARFAEAISAGEIITYGNPKNHRMELPMKMTADSVAVHAVFTESGKDIPWTIHGFRLRTGDDVRFCISDEYKAECTAAEKPLEVPAEVVPEEVKMASPAGKEEKKPQFKGETVPNESGYPMELTKFSRPIPPKMLQLLSEMAEEEQWSLSEEDPFYILSQYLNERFIRLGFEGKIGIHHGRDCNDYAAFHTGLFTKDLHEPIYACFLPQFHDEYYDGPLWHLDGFCCETEGGVVFERMKKFFPAFPTDANFMQRDGTYLPSWKYLMDPQLPVDLKEEHILQERGHRLPADFLEKIFRKAKDNQALEYLRKLKGLETEHEKKSFWMREFSPYLEHATETYDRLLQQMEYVVQEACDCNIRQPIPAYYPRDNMVTWLLPLRFHEDSNLKNLVLIVRAKEDEGYKGITVMNIEDIYHHARTIRNPDCSWLRSEILDNYKFTVEIDEEE